MTVKKETDIKETKPKKDTKKVSKKETDKKTKKETKSKKTPKKESKPKKETKKNDNGDFNIIISKIVKKDIDGVFYVKQKTPKKQIIIHNTETENDLLQINDTLIKPNIIIDRNGIPYSLYSSSYYSNCLNIPTFYFNQIGLVDNYSRTETQLMLNLIIMDHCPNYQMVNID